MGENELGKVQSEPNQDRPGFFGERCAYEFEDGRSCNAPRLKDSIFCRHHDPCPRGEEAEQEPQFDPDLTSSLAIVASLRQAFKKKFDELAVLNELPSENDLKAFNALLRVQAKLFEEHRKSGGPPVGLSEENLSTFVGRLLEPVHIWLAKADWGDHYSDKPLTPRRCAELIYRAWGETFETFGIQPPLRNGRRFGWPWNWNPQGRWDDQDMVADFYEYWSGALVGCVADEVKDPKTLRRIAENLGGAFDQLVKGSPDI